MAKPHSGLVRTPSKFRPVPFSQIRVPPAFLTQRQFRPSHAANILANFDPDKLGYLIVNIRDGIAWLLDGQHRFDAVVKWLNPGPNDTIDCECYTDLTDKQMAHIFLGRDERRQVPPLDKFHIACTAEHPLETSVQRTVESNGQKISRDRRDGISTVGALCAVHDRSGPEVLGQVIRTINLGFSGDDLAFDRSIIEGLGLVYNRFNGKTNEKQMGARLNGLRHGARELLRKAESIRERTGNQKKHCVAAAVVEIYNKGEGPHSKTRLPAWWKEGTGAASTAKARVEAEG